MPKASELKKGDIVEIDGRPCVVKHIDVKSPSSRGTSTLYKFRFTSMQDGQNLQATHKGDDFFRTADVQRRQCQYLYADTQGCTFMDHEDYTQYTLSLDALEEQREYLIDGLEGIYALLIDGNIASVELPQSVDLEIVDTAPAMKGATATGRTKPARLTTGLEVQVPEYLANGDTIKVNTTNGKYMSRS